MFVIVTVLYCPDSCTAVDTSSTDEKHLHSATGKREPSCSRRRRGEPRGKEERNMIRARLVLVFVTFMAGYPSKAQVPGFQGTVNNYSVGMNPDEGCRHASNGKPACSQWFRLKFSAPLSRRANCIKGKGADTDYHERRAEIQWSFKTDPAVGQRGADLYGYAVDYEDIGINFDFPGAGIVKKVAEAVITAA